MPKFTAFFTASVLVHSYVEFEAENLAAAKAVAMAMDKPGPEVFEFDRDLLDDEEIRLSEVIADD